MLVRRKNKRGNVPAIFKRYRPRARSSSMWAEELSGTRRLGFKKDRMANI